MNHWWVAGLSWRLRSRAEVNQQCCDVVSTSELRGLSQGWVALWSDPALHLQSWFMRIVSVSTSFTRKSGPVWTTNCLPVRALFFSCSVTFGTKHFCSWRLPFLSSGQQQLPFLQPVPHRDTTGMGFKTTEFSSCRTPTQSTLPITSP